MPNDPQSDYSADGPEITPPPEPLNKNQKIAAAILAVFAVLIIVLWFAQLKNNIYSPFLSNSGDTEEQTAEEQAVAEEQALKNKDTDGDGLNDYDELNIYTTSPYLADSDGDGLKDGQEITDGADPNCPKGKTCAGNNLLKENNYLGQATSTTSSPESGLNNLSSQNATLESLLNQMNASQPQAQSAGGSSGLNSDQLNALKDLDASSLRQLLIENGMPKATLDKISDTDLLKSFQETMNE